MKYLNNKIKYMLSEILNSYELTSNDEVLLSKLLKRQVNIRYAPYIHPEPKEQIVSFYCLRVSDGPVLNNFLLDLVSECYVDGLISFKPRVEFYVTKDYSGGMLNQEACRVVIER